VFRSIARALPALALIVAPVVAQDVDAIFARYNRAVDPENKVASLAGIRVTAVFEVPAQGMRASMTIHQQRPNLMTSILNLQGVGEMRQGFDGRTAWASDPMQGPRILTGPEAAQIADGADFATMRRERALFAKVEGAGEAEFDGEKCSRIKLTWKSGRATTECFSVTSGLIIETGSNQATPQGEIQVSTRLHDYKPVGGVLMPHRVVASAMGASQVITISEASVGVQDAKLFELPPAIKALRGNP
jgi:hypothetical protein